MTDRLDTRRWMAELVAAAQHRRQADPASPDPDLPPLRVRRADSRAIHHCADRYGVDRHDVELIVLDNTRMRTSRTDQLISSETVRVVNAIIRAADHPDYLDAVRQAVTALIATGDPT